MPWKEAESRQGPHIGEETRPKPDKMRARPSAWKQECLRTERGGEKGTGKTEARRGPERLGKSRKLKEGALDGVGKC